MKRKAGAFSKILFAFKEEKRHKSVKMGFQGQGPQPRSVPPGCPQGDLTKPWPCSRCQGKLPPPSSPDQCTERGALGEHGDRINRYCICNYVHLSNVLIIIISAHPENIQAAAQESSTQLTAESEQSKLILEIPTDLVVTKCHLPVLVEPP